MDSKSPKRQPAANLLGGWGKPAICYCMLPVGQGRGKRFLVGFFL